MTDTIDDVAAEAAQEEPAAPALDEQGVAEQLVAQAREKGIELVGPNGLLSQLTKRVLETALEAEMSDHLGYDKHDPVGRNHGNSRNGVRSKTVLTEIGPVDIEVPRDVDASFEPTIVKKRQRRLTGVDQIVLSLSARGLTTGEISAHFAEVYGASVSRETVSKITDQVLEEMSAWMNRPLDEVYPVIFIDAIVVKVRDGQVRNKPIYVVIGVTVNGERDILGLWAGDGGEGAKFWLQVLTELKNRGVADVCIAVCDGLKGPAGRDQHRLGADHGAGLHHPPDPQHLPLRVAEILGPDRPRPAAGLHRRHRGRSRARFEEFAEKWGKPYPAINRLWQNAWTRVRAVPGLRRGDPQDHLQHQCDRVAERPLPAGRAGPRPLPQRAGRAEMSLPDHPITGPDRQGQGTMGHKVETGPERVRHHVPRPHPNPMITDQIRSTVYLIDPRPAHLRRQRSAQGACPRFDRRGVWLFDLDVRCQLAVSTSGFGRWLWVCFVALVWPFLGEDGVDVLVGPFTFPPG